MDKKLAWSIGMGLSLALGAASAALAQEQVAGWYIGGSIGESKVDVDQEGLDGEVVFLFEDAGATVLSGSSSIEDSDTTFAVYGGYRFSRYFALEGGYQDLGGFSYSSSGAIGIPGLPGTLPAGADMEIDSSGFTLAGVGAIPLGERFDVHGKVGIYFAENELRFTANIAGVSDGFTEKESSEELFYGLGAAFRFGRAWSASLDYQIFKEVGDAETGEADVDTLSLGLTYSF